MINHLKTSQLIKNLVDKLKKCLLCSEILAYKLFFIKSNLSNMANSLDKKWSLISTLNNVVKICYKRLDSPNWPFIST